MIAQNYDVEQEPLLIRACSEGDRQAFDVLWQHYRGRIFNFVYSRVGSLEETEDLTQETFIRAWSAMSRGTQVAAFAPWLYRIARNVINDWADRRRRAGVPEPLDDQQEQMSKAAPVEQTVAFHMAGEFLVSQLDEVLIDNADTLEGKKLGYLRKLAFMALNADRLTLPQIQVELASYAHALGIPAPTLAQLNNWLSRGDILSSLVRHLIADHADWITATIHECLGDLDLSAQETEIARLRWQEGMATEAIAERIGLSIGDVARVQERIARRLIPQVSACLKDRLHKCRTRS